jgi:hypothetical protein
MRCLEKKLHAEYQKGDGLRSRIAEDVSIVGIKRPLVALIGRLLCFKNGDGHCRSPKTKRIGVNTKAKKEREEGGEEIHERPEARAPSLSSSVTL